MNTPYVKHTDAMGKILNPITKENPYSSKRFVKYEKDEFGELTPVFYPNRSERRTKAPRQKVRYGKQYIQNIEYYSLNDKTVSKDKFHQLSNKERSEIKVLKKQIIHTRNN